MVHDFRNSPFVVSTGGSNPLDAIGDYSGGQPALDHLGESSLGDLYWNNGTPTMGLVCGPSVSILPIYAPRRCHVLSEPDYFPRPKRTIPSCEGYYHRI
jgi:hypothetical protein